MDAANEMSSNKAFMIVLGGLLKVMPIVTLENVIKGLKKTLPERHHHLIPMNEGAICRGMDLNKKYKQRISAKVTNTHYDTRAAVCP